MSVSLSARAARLGVRIDALSLRERAILFASIALLMLAALDQAVLTPTLADQRARNARLLKQGTEVEQMRVQVKALASARPAGATEEDRLLAAVQAAQARQQALARQIDSSRAANTQPVHLPALLARALQRHDRLTLVHLVSRSPREVAGAASGVALNNLFLPTWQAAELSVAGSYADLSRFVAETERGLPGLRWGELRLATDTNPPVMTLQLWLQGEAP